MVRSVPRIATRGPAWTSSSPARPMLAARSHSYSSLRRVPSTPPSRLQRSITTVPNTPQPDLSSLVHFTSDSFDHTPLSWRERPTRPPRASRSSPQSSGLSFSYDSGRRLTPAGEGEAFNASSALEPSYSSSTAGLSSPALARHRTAHTPPPLIPVPHPPFHAPPRASSLERKGGHDELVRPDPPPEPPEAWDADPGARFHAYGVHDPPADFLGAFDEFHYAEFHPSDDGADHHLPDDFADYRPPDDVDVDYSDFQLADAEDAFHPSERPPDPACSASSNIHSSSIPAGEDISQSSPLPEHLVRAARIKDEYDARYIAARKERSKEKQKQQMLRGMRVKADREGGPSVVEILHGKGHQDYYGPREDDCVEDTYEDFYARCLVTAGGHTRTDLRTTYEGDPRFDLYSLSFQPHNMAQQQLEAHGILNPSTPEAELLKSPGYQGWLQARLRVKKAGEHAIAVRETMVREQGTTLPVSISSADFDRLKDSSLTGESIFVACARKCSVKLDPEVWSSDRKRVQTVARGEAEAIDKFKRMMASLPQQEEFRLVAKLPLGNKPVSKRLMSAVIEPYFRSLPLGVVELEHVSINLRSPPLGEFMTEVSVSSRSESMAEHALRALKDSTIFYPRYPPLYVARDRPKLLGLEREPNGRVRLRAPLGEREAAVQPCGTGSLGETVFEALIRTEGEQATASDEPSSPNGAPIEEHEHIDTPLENDEPYDAALEGDEPAAAGAVDPPPVPVRVEARFGKFTYAMPDEGADLATLPVQERDLVSQLTGKHRFSPQTGISVERLQDEWLLNAITLRTERVHRIEYVEASDAPLTTGEQRALVFESRGPTTASPEEEVPLGACWGELQARLEDRRTLSILQPRRNYDAIILTSSSMSLPISVIPVDLRRPFDQKLPCTQTPAIHSRPDIAYHDGRAFYLRRHETLVRTTYLVEVSDVADMLMGGRVAWSPEGALPRGRKAVLEKVTCLLRPLKDGMEAATYEHITLEADDPAALSEEDEATAYLPIDMLTDVDHMLCMEDHTWC